MRSDDQGVPAASAGARVAMRGGAREHWEIIAASGILVGVLATIDTVFIGQAALVLSVAPFVFILLAALVRLTTGIVAFWIGAFLLLALVTRDARCAALAYPALAMMVLLAVQRRREKQA
jgi:hypothetical protein